MITVPVGHPYLRGKVESELFNGVVFLVVISVALLAGSPPPLEVALAKQPHRRVPVKVLVVAGRGDCRERRLAVLDRVPHRGQLGPHRNGLASGLGGNGVWGSIGGGDGAV